MITFEITVIDYDNEFVKYTFSSGGIGTTGRKWFTDISIGKKYIMVCDGALVKSVTAV